MNTTTFQSITCNRCSGSGKFKTYGSCLRCEGRGVVHTYIGRRSWLYAKAVVAKGGTVKVAIERALDLQSYLLMQQAMPAPQGVPEEAPKPKPRKRRSKAATEQVAA